MEKDFPENIIELLENENALGYTGEDRVINPVDYEALQREAEKDSFY